MNNSNEDIFRHLTEAGVQIHNPEPLAAIATEIQAHLQAIPDAEARVRAANEFQRDLDLSEPSLTGWFQQAFAVDVTSLPDDLAKLIVYFVITAALPGHDPNPPSPGIDHVFGGSFAAVGLALLQDDQRAAQGIDTLERIAALLP